jgi:hypothetical protein
MGADRADTHIHLHGEGTTHHAPEVRLHWGAQGIDETHDATSAIVLAWAASYVAGDWAQLQSDLYAWMTSAGVSSAAWAKRADFAGALRRAWGTA